MLNLYLKTDKHPLGQNLGCPSAFFDLSFDRIMKCEFPPKKETLPREESLSFTGHFYRSFSDEDFVRQLRVSCVFGCFCISFARRGRSLKRQSVKSDWRIGTREGFTLLGIFDPFHKQSIKTT